MRYGLMRRLDNWLGFPLCLALGLAERLIRLFGPPPSFPPADSVRRILVTKYIGAGSVVEASPMLRALRGKYPSARISFLTFEACGELGLLLGVFDEIRIIRTKSVAVFAWDNLKALLWGRLRRFDVSYDLEFFSKYSYLVSYLIHARARVGYFVRVLRYVRLFTHPVPYNARRHVSEVFMAQLNPESGEGSEVSPVETVSVPAEAEREIGGLFERMGVPGDRALVAFNVNTGELSRLRQWPLPHFAELAEALHAAYGCTLVFVGGKEDGKRVEEVMAKLGPAVKAFNLSGATTLAGLLALLKRVRVLVSNDSGPLHMAALAGIPSVGLFGAESAAVYGPRGDKHINLDRELYCSPCLNVYNFKDFDCPYDLRCMREIVPREVLHAVRRLLGPRPETAAR